MKFTMLPIQIAMIVAMPAAPAATVPAAMLRPMIPRLVAMKYAMLAPVRIGRMQVPMVPPRIAMIFPVRAAWLVVAVVRGGDVELVALLRLALDLPRTPELLSLPLGALELLDLTLEASRGLDTPGLHALRPFGAPHRADVMTRFTGGSMAWFVLMGLNFLRHCRHRRSRRKQKSHQQFLHRSTPDTPSFRIRVFGCGL